MLKILLVRVGQIEPLWVQELKGYLEQSMGARCRVNSETVSVEDTYHSERGQYYSTPILERVLGLGTDKSEIGLGICDVDLYLPILTFVFGEALLRGNAALVSISRLRQEFYGLPPDRDLLRRRLEKEAVHELGHTLGLIHCKRVDCTMHFSNSIEEVDMKSDRFCLDCQSIADQTVHSFEQGHRI